MPDKSKKKNERGSVRNNLSGPVQAKKFLGQHFLRDEQIASRIADTLSLDGYREVLEIGPGTGMLTKYLLKRELRLTVLEIDRQSLAYLRGDFLSANTLLLENEKDFRILQADVLRVDFHDLYGDTPFAIIGNFPYNISTQIVFRMLEMRRQVPEFSGMFQKEVAQRICAREGSKTYGILSVLVQAFYEATYLFTVPPEVFDPPPKVESGVLILRRRKEQHLPCDETLFFRVVKTAFNQRRKTLRNSLKSFLLSDNLKEDTIFDLRPEQLTVDHFIALSKKIEHDTV